MNNDGQSGDTVSYIKPAELAEIKVQLRSIRNQVNKLLDILDINQVPSQTEIQPESNTEQVSNGSGAASHTVINKVNSSEFDPLQDKKQNSSDVQKDTSAASSTTNVGHNEGCENRPQSVPVRPTPTPPIAANQNPYIRTPTTGVYPQQSFGNIPYPTQQFTYSSAGYVQQDQPQLSTSSAYGYNPQANMPYATQQQQYSQPGVVNPAAGVYPGQGQGNPYSKGYSQPQYMQPR